MRRAKLTVRRYTTDAPVVPRAEAELNGRRIGARAADRAVGVAAALAERYAVRPARVAHLRDRLAEVPAGRIQVDQRRGVLLLALIPGGRPLERQSRHYAGHERSLHALDDEVLAVGVEEDVAGHFGVEESDLDVVPGLPIQGAVPLQPMVEKLRLPADLVVGQLVG